RKTCSYDSPARNELTGLRSSLTQLNPSLISMFLPLKRQLTYACLKRRNNGLRDRLADQQNPRRSGVEISDAACTSGYFLLQPCSCSKRGVAQGKHSLIMSAALSQCA